MEKLWLQKRIKNLGTLNIQGLRGKFEEVLKEVEERQLSMVALTETKKKGQGTETIGDYIHLHSGVPKHSRAKRGVYSNS
jgi:hypothetical protein